MVVEPGLCSVVLVTGNTLTFTPVLQTSFLFEITHVNFLLAYTAD